MAAPSRDTCEVMERSIRDRVPPLLTDLYQFTMAYAYWRAGRDQEPAVFELFFRDNPFDGGFSLFAGVHDCLLFLRSFRFTGDGEGVSSDFTHALVNQQHVIRVTLLFSQVDFVFSKRFTHSGVVAQQLTLRPPGGFQSEDGTAFTLSLEL